MNEKDKKNHESFPKINTGLPTPPDTPPESPVLRPTKPNQENSLDQLTNKILEEQKKFEEKIQEFSKKIKEKDGEIWQLKISLSSFKNQVKALLEINFLKDLPADWNRQLVKKTDLILAQNELKEWKNKFPNKTPQEISWKITKLQSEKSEAEKELKKVQPQTSTIYFCDICQTSKNSKVDGEVYRIKISIRPNILSSICPNCRPNVVAVLDENWKDF
ncbi:MAG: hypothetical protein I3273_04015 [Candidatus Moeniiplasma glomeromycotorum]|nr:hypothetical protein [Candidatus Moeniiplasma glomeromycotorum]